MKDLTRQDIEGRLNAHRELLVTILSRLLKEPAGAEILRYLEQDDMPLDGAEDPGLTPSAGYAREAVMADEVRAVLNAARARAAAS
ncbi:hypothetical protein [Ciceribacter thiooxidans]|uniref:Uncharacterized protein n=1 Tax=Ciceribacter thiooxidans TaxID=1969821 RepID=A0ABV7HYT8_9HYPH|nr:hypothetical protein [Ciceribacter thiooxidans]